MNYSIKVINDAAKVLASRRREAEMSAQQRKKDFSEKHPELIDIEREMANTALDTVKAMQNCDDPKGFIEKLRDRNLKYQKLREELFKSAGYDKNYLKPQYTCPVCKDLGYVDGKPCACFEDVLKKLAFKELAHSTPLKISSFNDFDVSLYPDKKDSSGVSIRDRMNDIFNFCKDYAEDFDTSSPSLFMYGETGLGKTHLSLAIAGKAIEKGYGVIYGSAQNLLSMVEREKFGRSNEADGTTEDKLLCCDLLILDDLGAEFSTQFTVAEIYNIINSRLAASLPTIINSNVPIEELEKRYQSRITSRIIGTYTTLRFFGNDIRQIKG